MREETCSSVVAPLNPVIRAIAWVSFRESFARTSRWLRDPRPHVEHREVLVPVLKQTWANVVRCVLH